jgi:pimeloyl-ACP methyl ester carboxylesterase
MGNGPHWWQLSVPAQAPVTEHYVLVSGGARLWCWDTGGEGEPVVLLHPGSGSGESWPYQQPVLAKRGYRVIGYSRRGKIGSTAGSQGPATDSGDLHTLVEHLGLGSFHLLGAAAGGCVAADYALSYGDRLLGLVIASSLVGITDTDYEELSGRLRPKGFDDLPIEFQELGPSFRGGDPAGVARWLEIANRADSGSGAQRRPSTANRITWSALERLDVPTLLMTGDADLYTPPSIMRLIAAHLPGCRTAVVAESGHNPQWEQPESFNDAVLDFLCQL